MSKAIDKLKRAVEDAVEHGRTPNGFEALVALSLAAIAGDLAYLRDRVTKEGSTAHSEYEEQFKALQEKAKEEIHKAWEEGFTAGEDATNKLWREKFPEGASEEETAAEQAAAKKAAAEKAAAAKKARGKGKGR